MISIFIKAHNANNLRDIVRSLINNAEKRENYKIYVGADDGVDFSGVVSEFKDRAEIHSVISGEVLAVDTELVWMLTDEVFILGFHWDKRILFYKDRFPDDIIVMFPSGYKSYGTKSEQEIAVVAERFPVLSAQWIEIAGMQHAEMICRSLLLKHAIDRRVDIRLVDIQARGALSPQPEYDSMQVEKKADAIAEFILNDRSK